MVALGENNIKTGVTSGTFSHTISTNDLQNSGSQTINFSVGVVDVLDTYVNTSLDITGFEIKNNNFMAKNCSNDDNPLVKAHDDLINTAVHYSDQNLNLNSLMADADTTYDSTSIKGLEGAISGSNIDPTNSNTFQKDDDLDFTTIFYLDNILT